MWQTSDKVTEDTITAVTESCDREDCKLSARVGETTLVGGCDYYDKAGRLHVKDSNSRRTRVDCGTCWRIWYVNHDHGNVGQVIDITAQETAKFAARHAVIAPEDKAL